MRAFDGEGHVEHGVGHVDRGVALARAGSRGVVLHPVDGVEEEAALGGLEELVHQHVGEGDAVGGGEGAEAQRVARGQREVLQAYGFVEGVVGEGARDAALLDGGVEL